jgi:hypothetical protein
VSTQPIRTQTHPGLGQVFADELGRLRAVPARPARRPLLVTLALLAARVVAALPRARTALLSVAGFALLSAAAWTVAVPLGLAAAGASLLVLEWLTEERR